MENISVSGMGRNSGRLENSGNGRAPGSIVFSLNFSKFNRAKLNCAQFSLNMEVFSHES